MDKKRGIKNITVSIVFRVVLTIAAIVVRRFVIRYIGNEVNGLNSLYASLLEFLAVAELGVGSAITFCMYKPIVEGDTDKVSALYGLFTKIYFIIAGVITIAAGCLMPFLKYLAKDYAKAGVNLYLTFGLMLISVVVSYFFSAKTSLINAYKNNYITTTINSVGQFLQDGLQILVLVLKRSFVLFLICRIISICLQWLVTEIYARYKYGDIIKNKQKVDADTKKEVTKNAKAMFMHKIGGILVNTADSIIISAFIGIVILGKYSNYTTIVVSMSNILFLCFTPLTSVIGHMFVEEGSEASLKYCRFFHTLNFILGTVFFLGYYAVIDNLVAILFGNNLELSRAIAMVITVDYFIQFMRQAVLLFRDATGTFYYDRWKPLVEGLINIVLSILFVVVFPEAYRVVGVIVATIITDLFICHIVEPYVLYKHAFKRRVRGYYIRNYLYILMFTAALIALHFGMLSFASRWIELLVNGCIAIAIAAVPCLVAILLNRDFGYYIKRLFATFKERGGNEPLTAAEEQEDAPANSANVSASDNEKENE